MAMVADRREYLAALIDMVRVYDPHLAPQWADRLAEAVEPIELGARRQAVIQAALDAMVHPAMAVIVAHMEQAFDAGSNVAELLEAVVTVGNMESGVHGIHDGIEALGNAIDQREGRGAPVPREGDPLGPRERIGRIWHEPARFPGEIPMRHPGILEKYDPDLWLAFEQWNDACLELRHGLTRKMEEFLFVAVDSMIRWPIPLLDRHMHAAFEVGATVQELLEVVMTCATADQGARESNIAGRQLVGGPEIVRYALGALDRVIAERTELGLAAPDRSLN